MEPNLDIVELRTNKTQFGYYISPLQYAPTKNVTQTAQLITMHQCVVTRFFDPNCRYPHTIKIFLNTSLTINMKAIFVYIFYLFID